MGSQRCGNIPDVKYFDYMYMDCKNFLEIVGLMVGVQQILPEKISATFDRKSDTVTFAANNEASR
jgi:hypothetical protein